MKHIALATALLLSSLTTHAVVTEEFGPLLSELANRANTLTNSPSSTDQKLGKACVKAIATLNKSTTLAGDAKAAGKVGKALAKAFPAEFIFGPFARRPATIKGVVLNDLSDLLDQGILGIVGEIESGLAELQADIDALPAGNDKDKAQAAYNAAVAAFDAGEIPFLAGDYATSMKLVGAAIKNIIKGFAIVDSATGGGGGGGGSTALSMLVDSVAWSADTFIGVDYVSATGEFALGGTRTNAPESILNIIIPTGVNGPGTYSLAGNGFYQVGIFPTIPTIYNITSGSITITTLNATTASGTFSFSATDGVTTITVTQGAFTAPLSQ